jgi:NAD(P)-dependent dehydrogenase (short-subunit alcohol dehydrogenase family)
MGVVPADARAVKRIFLTGTSAGIGLRTAEILCQKGHEVWGTGRTLAKLPVMERFHPVVLDLNDKDSIEHAFSTALRDAGSFDVLINNAGAGVFGPLESFSDEEFLGQFETLLLGPLRLIRLALPDMRARNAGLIVNVSSLAGEFPLPFMAPYSMNKAALSALSEGLGLELAHTGVRVVDVRPGDFATNFHESTRRIGSELASEYQPNLIEAWHAIDRNMKRAKSSRAVAELLVAIVEGRVLGPVQAVGDIFQAGIARLLARSVRRSWVQWGLRKYYGLRGA